MFILVWFVRGSDGIYLAPFLGGPSRTWENRKFRSNLAVTGRLSKLTSWVSVMWTALMLLNLQEGWTPSQSVTRPCVTVDTWFWIKDSKDSQTEQQRRPALQRGGLREVNWENNPMLSYDVILYVIYCYFIVHCWRKTQDNKPSSQYDEALSMLFLFFHLFIHAYAVHKNILVYILYIIYTHYVYHKSCIMSTRFPCCCFFFGTHPTIQPTPHPGKMVRKESCIGSCGRRCFWGRWRCRDGNA